MSDILKHLAARHGKEPWEVNGEARQVMIQQETDLKILLGVLGNTYGGPSISHENGMWTLYVWSDAPVGMDVICRHEEWPEFIRLVAEYSEEIPE